MRLNYLDFFFIFWKKGGGNSDCNAATLERRFFKNYFFKKKKGCVVLPSCTALWVKCAFKENQRMTFEKAVKRKKEKTTTTRLLCISCLQMFSPFLRSEKMVGGDKTGCAPFWLQLLLGDNTQLDSTGICRLIAIKVAELRNNAQSRV